MDLLYLKNRHLVIGFIIQNTLDFFVPRVKSAEKDKGSKTPFIQLLGIF